MEEIELAKPDLTQNDEVDGDCKSEKSEASTKKSDLSEEEPSQINEVIIENGADDKKTKKKIKRLMNWKKKPEKETEENASKVEGRPKNPFQAEMGEPGEKRDKYASFNSMMNRVSSSTTRLWHSINKTFLKTPGDNEDTVDGGTITPENEKESTEVTRKTMTLGRVFSRKAGKPKDSLDGLNLEENKSRTLGRRIVSTLRAPFKQQEEKQEK